MLALHLQKYTDLCEFKANLIYIVGPGYLGLYSETLTQKKVGDKQGQRYIIIVFI